jgi:hypothetical protein
VKKEKAWSLLTGKKRDQAHQQKSRAELLVRQREN